MKGLSIENLSIGYRRKTVARGLNGFIASGRLTCLVGRNGLGKSTLLRTIAGLLRPLSGRIVWTGDDADGRQEVGATAVVLSELDFRQMARLVSIVLTEKAACRGITAWQMVAMGRMPYTDFLGRLTDADRQVVAESLGMTGVADLSERDVSTLSDGELQKVMIARALAQQTPVILLDEPTAYLDFQSKVDAMRLLRRLAHDMGKLILVSTHDLDIALHFADAMLTLADGKAAKAIANAAQADGNAAQAIGQPTQADGNAAQAIGQSTQAGSGQSTQDFGQSPQAFAQSTQAGSGQSTQVFAQSPQTGSGQSTQDFGQPPQAFAQSPQAGSGLVTIDKQRLESDISAVLENKSPFPLFK